MSNLLAALQNVDEAYLTALTNKGLYKRAVRELEETDIRLELEDAGLMAFFPDGTQVTIKESLQNYQCNCPSRSMCKHLLMAVLAFQSQKAPNSGAEADAPAPPPDFSGIYNAALEESSILTVTLGSGHIIRFLAGAPLEEAGCSCKSASFCGHKLKAVLLAIRQKNGGYLPEPFLPTEEEAPLEFSTYALPAIQDYLQQVFTTGLARLPEESSHRFEQLATICHSRRLANMERICSRIAGHLALFEKKNASFQREFLISDLCALVKNCESLANGAADKETVGVFRESYRSLPSLELYGLGAYQWHSVGGYTGVTILLFCADTDELFTYTTALPQSANPSAEKMYTGAAPWNLLIKLAVLSHTHFSLTGGKASEKNQLSSSESVAGKVIGSTDILSPALAPLRYDDFYRLIEAMWQLRQNDGIRLITAILLPARYGAILFDEISQTLTIPVYDSGERRLTLEVRYEPSNSLLIQNLQRLESKLENCPLLVRVTLRQGQLSAFPITLYGKEGPVNLGLDHEKNKSTAKKKTIIDWGI